MPGSQALILQTPLTHDGRLKIRRKKAEAEIQGGKIELGNLGGNAAGFVGQVAARLAVVPHNSLLTEEIAVVWAGKHYMTVEQWVGAVDIVVEEAAGSGFVGRVLPAWAENQTG